MNHLSPWLSGGVHKAESIQGNCKTDVLIIGGGIAGVMTAKFLLEYTRLRIVLAEAKQIAIGATGHNAGLVVNGFESGIPELAQRFRETHIQEALKAGSRGLQLIRAILQAQGDRVSAGFVPYNIFYGDRKLAKRHMAIVMKSYPVVSKMFTFRQVGRCASLPHTGEVADHFLCNSKFICSFGKCLIVDPVALTRNLAAEMLRRFSNRFHIYELSPISQIRKARVGFKAKSFNNTVDSNFVVLCNNAYPIDQNISERLTRVRPVKASLQGIISNRSESRSAWGKFQSDHDDDFVYGNSREFHKRNLTVVGGASVQRFAASNQGCIWRWSGNQGYTDSGIRYIMEEPSSPGCFLNLGCNGIGMALATFGGERIARMIRGETFQNSIFDESNLT